MTKNQFIHYMAGLKTTGIPGLVFHYEPNFQQLNFIVFIQKELQLFSVYEYGLFDAFFYARRFQKTLNNEPYYEDEAKIEFENLKISLEGIPKTLTKKDRFKSVGEIDKIIRNVIQAILKSSSISSMDPRNPSKDAISRCKCGSNDLTLKRIENNKYLIQCHKCGNTKNRSYHLHNNIIDWNRCNRDLSALKNLPFLPLKLDHIEEEIKYLERFEFLLEPFITLNNPDSYDGNMMHFKKLSALREWVVYARKTLKRSQSINSYKKEVSIYLNKSFKREIFVS
jgi:hypothetical protein